VGRSETGPRAAHPNGRADIVGAFEGLLLVPDVDLPESGEQEDRSGWR
jgi:hypothetical protein